MTRANAAENKYYALMGPGVLETVSKPLPPLARHWVRVRFAFCGVCGSDLSRFDGRRAANYPVSMGHEWVAVVEAVGPELRYFSPGDVVTTDLNFRCGSCRQCVSGRSHLCDQGQVGRFTNRGFGIRADIHASYLQKCSGNPAPCLSLAEPLSCVRHAYSWAKVAPEDRVLIVGAGSIGLCMSFLLTHLEPRVAFELTDLQPARLASIARLISPVGKAVGHPTGEYDVVFDLSGTGSGLRTACEAVVAGGRLCTMSHLADGAPVEFLFEQLPHKDVTFTISYLNGEPSNLAVAIQLLERYWDKDWDTVLEVRPLEALPLVMANRPTSPWSKTVIDLACSAGGDK